MCLLKFVKNIVGVGHKEDNVLGYSELDIIRGRLNLIHGKGKTLLYVGVNQRRAFLLRAFAEWEYDIELIEIFKANVDFCKRYYAFPIIHGDICKADELLTKQYDVIAWIHGPEHIKKIKLESTLKKLEKKTKFVLLIVPEGNSSQGIVDNNKYEKHLWDPYMEDFQNLGYKVQRESVNNKALVAWKGNI